MPTPSNKAINTGTPTNKEYTIKDKTFAEITSTFSEITNPFHTPEKTTNKALNNITSGNVTNKTVNA